MKIKVTGSAQPADIFEALRSGELFCLRKEYASFCEYHAKGFNVKSFIYMKIMKSGLTVAGNVNAVGLNECALFNISLTEPVIKLDSELVINLK
jgi:hypothetical protein